MRSILDVPPQTAGRDALLAMLNAVMRGACRDLEHSETLPPATYVSDEFFALEAEKIFKPGWVCVGHVSQVAEAGDYFTLDLFDEMLVIARGRDNVIRTLSRICTHRWAPLIEGMGNTKLFSCPFHKWGFDLTGKLLGAPLMDKVEFRPEDCDLTRFPTEVIDGFIYVNLSGDAPALHPQLSDLSKKLAKFKLNELVVAGEYNYDCKFNWKIMVETFMECYHHIAAHPETFEAAFPARLSYIEDGRPAWTSGVAPARETVRDEEITIGLPLLSTDLNTFDQRCFQLFLIYPFHMINIWPDRVYWFRSQPAGADRTIVQTYVLARPEAKTMPDYKTIMKKEMQFVDKVNLEDFNVNNMQQLGAKTAAARPGRLSHLEKAVWQLSDYIRAKIV